MLKIQLLVILILTSLGFAKSYTVLDNRFNTPVESVLVVRLVDSSSVYTDSLGVFEFDEITPIQDIKKIENTQKWVDASGRVVVKPDPLRMKAFEVSSSEVVEFNSFKKVGFDFNLTRSGYDSKSVSDVDSVIVLDKQVLGDSILYSRIYNDTYKRKLYTWEASYDSIQYIDSVILHKRLTESPLYIDSLEKIRDSVFYAENRLMKWVDLESFDPLFDSIWVLDSTQLGYEIKGDTSLLCTKEIDFASYHTNGVAALGDSCFDSLNYPNFSQVFDDSLKALELNIWINHYIEKQTQYFNVMNEIGYAQEIGFFGLTSMAFILTIGIDEKYDLEVWLLDPSERAICGEGIWGVDFFVENETLKKTIIQPENCKWLTE